MCSTNLLELIELNLNIRPNKKIGVYVIYCRANHKYYIGSSLNVYKRWYLHKFNLNKRKHHSTYLQNAWLKYGEDSFLFALIEETSRETLLAREQYYLDAFKAYIPEFGFNVAKTAGLKTFLGKKHSEETKKRMSENSKGKYVSEETRKKIGEASRRRLPATPETRKKLSECVKNRKMTSEYRQKLSNSARGKHTNLTKDQVLKIREECLKPYFKGMYRLIARDNNIDERNLHAIRTRKTWTWI